MEITLFIIYLIDFVFIALKIEEKIDIHWLWILSPYWIPFLFLVAREIIAGITYVWNNFSEEMKIRKQK